MVVWSRNVKLWAAPEWLGRVSRKIRGKGMQ